VRLRIAQHIVFIILLIGGVDVFGDHLLGGEITYKHVQDDEYKVYVHVYRDCNGCKIDGAGGGSSSVNCGKIPLFLRSSTDNGCTSIQLARFDLTRTSIRSVLPTCASQADACALNATLSLGIEEHVFEATVDLNDYRSYFQCGFEFFIQAASRIEDATNLDNTVGSDPPLYNYCYLNPALKTSSPRYKGSPTFIASCNQPVYLSLFDKVNGLDSLVTKVSRPLKGYQDEISFNTGYSSSEPLKVYCPAANCDPLPYGNPVEGFYVNAETGLLAYTPTKCNEMASLVLETEHWVKSNQGYELNSIIRRDFVQQVLPLRNMNPILKSIESDSIFACSGIEKTFRFHVLDTALWRPDGTRLKQDTVRITGNSDLNGVDFRMIATDSAPYYFLDVTVDADATSAREKPYLVNIDLRDDFCPFNGSSAYTFKLFISKNPEDAVTPELRWCRRVELINGSDDFSTTWIKDSKDTLFQQGVSRDTLYFSNSIEEMQLDFMVEGSGCTYVADTVLSFLPEDRVGAILVYDLIGNNCLNKRIEVEHTNTDSFDAPARWITATDTAIERVNALLTDLETQILGITEKTRNGYTCRDTHTVALMAKPGPEISWNSPSLCPGAGTSLDLYDFVSPAAGTFEDVADMLEDNRYFKSDSVYDPRVPKSYCFPYTVTGSDGCANTDTVCVQTLSSPEAMVRDMSICYNSFLYNLDRTILEPYDYFNTDRHWYRNGIELPMINDAFDYDMANLSLGDNDFVFEVNYASGCSRTDTLTITLTNDPRIEFDVPDRICQNEDMDLAFLLKKDLGFGFWTSSSHPGDVFLNVLSKDVCGEVDLTYTYDNFGCYLTEDLTIDIDCKPEVNLNLPDTSCKGTIIDLFKEKPSDVWQIGSVFYPDLDSYRIPLTSDSVLDFIYTLGGEGCDFHFVHDMILSGAPEIIFSEEWDSSACMGDVLDISILDVKHGQLIDENGNHVALPLSYKEKLNTPGTNVFTFYKKGVGYCPDTSDNFTINVKPQVRVTDLDYDLEYCEPAIISPSYVWETNGAGNYVQLWTLINGIGDTLARNFTEPPVFSNLGRGAYSVGLRTKTSEGCIWDTLGHQALVFESPKASFIMNPNGKLSTKERTMEFFNRSEDLDSLTFEWDFGFDRPATFGRDQRIEFPYDTGTYEVNLIATNKFGCTDTARDQVYVGADFVIFVPNAFSPNSMGPEENNYFQVYADFVKSYELVIRSRWGDIVFVTNDPNAKWDGTFKGVVCPAGMYSYYIKARSATDELYEVKGFITLLK
jgi:gliding motility-associated-like protein